ncbi:MAG TPA: TonB family protein [Ohtaekwangia sp.]|nr:TonB family protein [Ohtaekwangia sp.]
MSDWKNDIERYWKGELSPAEMHALERRALDDPFLADALEGAQQVDPEEFSRDIEALQDELKHRTSGKKERTLWVWSLRIAAGVAILALGTFLVFKMPSEKQDIAMNTTTNEAEESNPQPTQTDSILMSTEDEVRELEAEKTTGVMRSRKAPRRIPPAAEEPELDVELEIPPLEMPAVARQPVMPERPATILEGVVVDSEDGRGLPGVNVTIKGTNTGTITNEEGKYQLRLDTISSALVFSYVGFETKEIMPSGHKVDVALDPDVSELSEIVVVGYGEARDPNIIEPTSIEIAAPEGGKKAFKQYLEQNLHYPEQALNNKIEGKVTVQFTLDSNGAITDFKVLKGLGYGCEDEVIRLIKSGPKWNPTRRNNEPVRDRVKVRMRFSLPKNKK